jgi:hypothetical protein
MGGKTTTVEEAWRDEAIGTTSIGEIGTSATTFDEPSRTVPMIGFRIGGRSRIRFHGLIVPVREAARTFPAGLPPLAGG